MLPLIVRTFGVLAAVVSATSTTRATLTLTQDKPGNVFYTTETVRLPVSGTGTRIEWRITDYFGTIVKSGSATFTDGSTVITPNLGKRGYFVVDFTEKDGTAVIATARTTFAALTPIDVSTMADSRFGAQTHFAQSHNPDILPVLARAGIAHVRDEQYWASIETTQGVFTYPAKFTNYMGSLAAASIKPLITLDWSNPFYDYDAGVFTGPYTDSGREGYANYALNLLNHYGSQIEQVEVWNEYNAGTFIKGPATADKDLYYFLMLKKVHETIKPAHPDVTVLAGATVPVAHGFLRDVFAHGAMPYLDAVSVHAYVGAETAELEIAGLRDLIKQYNNNQEKPIWATEFSESVTSPDEQAEGARHVVRIGTQLLNQNVARMYYYLSRDDGIFPHRGLVSSPTGPLGKYAPHPAYVSYAVFIRQLHGWTNAGRMSGTKTSTYVYKFTSGGTQRYVLWSTVPTTVYLSSTAANLKETDLMGTEVTRSVSGGQLIVQLGLNPIYITGAVSSVAEAPNPAIADSEADYSKTQGENGWSYGYAPLASDAAYTPADFVPMTWGIWTSYNYRWKGNGTYNFMTATQAHPTSSWAIRRWTSNTTATVDISGDVSRASANGDGTRLRVFVDGVEMFNQPIAPQAAFSYLVPDVAVVPGTKIDVAIVQEATSTDDATVCTARITKVMTAPVTLSLENLADYSGQTGSPGTAVVSPDGMSLTLTGNIWRKHPLSYAVTPSTMLEFTVDAANSGEILAIGLDENDSYSDQKRSFKVGGNQNDSAIFSVSQAYSTGEGPATYLIPIGAYFTGAMSHLTFIADDDARHDVEATFSNIRIYEAP